MINAGTAFSKGAIKFSKQHQNIKNAQLALFGCKKVHF